MPNYCKSTEYNDVQSTEHTVEIISIRLVWFNLGLWCLMPLSTIFQLYPGSQFYW
jgi:hypothetical protein